MAEPAIFPLLDLEAATAAAQVAGIAEVLARVNLFRTTLHHPPIGRIVGDVVEALVLHSVLDARLREIAILRTGWRLGSVYEWSNHYGIAIRAGLTDDEILAIREFGESPALTDADRCVIRLVDEVFDHVVVAPSTLREARTHVGDDRALMELVLIPGCYRTIGTVLLTFEIPLEDHVAAWPPDGRSPT
jgi:4-carboxymuconolactone decarboxylase